MLRETANGKNLAHRMANAQLQTLSGQIVGKTLDNGKRLTESMGEDVDSDMANDDYTVE